MNSAVKISFGVLLLGGILALVTSSKEEGKETLCGCGCNGEKKSCQDQAPVEIHEVGFEPEDNYSGKKALVRRVRSNKFDKFLTYSNYYQWLRKNFEILETIVRNTTSSDRVVTLWNTMNGLPVSSSQSTDWQDYTQANEIGASQPIFNHPQEAFVHPVSGLIWVLNQLSDSISIVSENGVLQETIELDNSSSGVISPGSMAYDLSTGRTYVLGSVSNTAIEVDPTGVISEIPVGNRPVRIKRNPVNGNMYVVNFLDNSVSVIDSGTSNVVSTFSVGQSPIDVAFHPVEGHVYVSNSGNGTVSVFDLNHLPVGQILGLGGGISSLEFHPLSGDLYVTDTVSNLVHVVDTSTLTIFKSIPVGDEPRALSYMEEGDFMCVASADEVLTFIDANYQALGQVPIVGFQQWIIYDATRKSFYYSATSSGTLNVLSLSDSANGVVVSDNYAGQAEDFKYNPILIQHSKWVHLGNEPTNLVYLKDNRTTGSKSQEVMQLNNYTSPQNGLAVAEVTQTRGVVLDGHQEWEFTLKPGQGLSIILYYTQLNRQDFLPSRQN